MKLPKKLIEVALPLEAINRASAREKSIRHGHPSTLHLWWARRPLAAARAVIFSQMVDDPSEYIDSLLAEDRELRRKAEKRLRDLLAERARAEAARGSSPDDSDAPAAPLPTLSEVAADLERDRLFKILEALVLWENTTNEQVLQAARDEIWKSWRRACAWNADHPRARELFDRHRLPAFHDPFAGGGALPLEAQRLGLEAHASDLNPVAVLINKAMIEIPPKFAGRPPANPESRRNPKLFERVWSGAQGLAEDVRHYGQWMRDEAEKRIGRLYPKIEITEAMVRDPANPRPDLAKYAGQKLTVIAWLWARTVRSPNPAFAHVEVPLASTFLLSTKPGKEAYVQPVLQGDSYRFTVKVGKPKDAAAAKTGTKTSRGAHFNCLMSGGPMPSDYIKAEGKAGRMGARLMAMVAEGDRGRVYLPPSDEQESIARCPPPEDVPTQELPLEDTGNFWCTIYGLTRFADLFTPRQLVALTTFSDLVTEAREKIRRDAEAGGWFDSTAAALPRAAATSPEASGEARERSAEVGGPSAAPRGRSAEARGTSPGHRGSSADAREASADAPGTPAGSRQRSAEARGSSADLRRSSAEPSEAFSEAPTGVPLPLRPRADDRPLADGGLGPAAYADAVAVYLAFAISKIANIGSSITSWMSDRGAFRETFARQAIPMVWDFAEANPLADAGGSLASVLDKGAMAIHAFPASENASVTQADAGSQGVSSGKVVSTDPPYYDNIGYADLSDFFYVWLRHSLQSVFPVLFATLAVPKTEELVATPYRHGGKKKAEAFFLDGMTRAMHRLADQAHAAFPVTIYYAFKQSEADGEDDTTNTGWDTFLAAVLEAGFAISGTWPMRTEGGGRLIALGTNALASSIVLVCRKRSEDAPTASRREFVSALERELSGALRAMQAGNIAPVDLAQAAIGPGMGVYTRYARVLDAEGRAIPVREALTLINQTLDATLAAQEGDFDGDSRWALAWFDQFGFDDGDYGVAETLSKAKNTSVGGLAEAGVVVSKGGKVRLLRPGELPEAWDPTKDARLTAWEAVHHLVRALESGGESAAAALVAKLGATAEIARELAYRLYALCERKKRAPEALSYNGLVQSWPEIAKLAREGAKGGAVEAPEMGMEIPDAESEEDEA